jgi:hypothetical protein
MFGGAGVGQTAAGQVFWTETTPTNSCSAGRWSERGEALNTSPQFPVSVEYCLFLKIVAPFLLLYRRFCTGTQDGGYQYCSRGQLNPYPGGKVLTLEIGTFETRKVSENFP